MPTAKIYAKWTQTLSVQRPMRRMATVLCTLTLTTGALAEEPKRIRIVGGLASVNQYTRQEEPFWTQELSRITAGQLVADIVPLDRSGIRGEEMLHLMRSGVVPFGTVPVGLAATQEPLLAGPDLAGLNPDFESIRKIVAAYRPVLDTTVRDRYGIKLLAVYIYPAQLAFCKTPLKGLADLSGRRVRIASATQADFIEALGGIPVRTQFSAIMANVKSASVDCAITGSMSGNTIGLAEITDSLYTMPITWGLSLFGANASAWSALPPETQAALSQALPKLEKAIWDEAERESSDGIACNTNSSRCVQGRRFAMKEVRPSSAEDTQRRALFANKVLTRWVLRCGDECAQAWNTHIGPVLPGVKAK
jgi:TRAP-type C4-dicarboxylate transport system substrate-binding protein